MVSKLNTKFEYNRLRYASVGKIMHKVSGEHFTDHITENPLQKAGIKRTKKADLLNLNSMVPHLARPYTYYYVPPISNIKQRLFFHYFRKLQK
jgi:CubicO group peptidase (beta-lactamase class C family)